LDIRRNPNERVGQPLGSATGSMLPFILKRLGFDPATASAPFVATLVDV
jgi:Mg/Co/Ni transporter MgtE